jgi:hypothetical protein
MYQLVAFCGSHRQKKNPETGVSGLKKPRLKIQTYLVTFGAKPASFDSKGL